MRNSSESKAKNLRNFIVVILAILCAAKVFKVFRTIQVHELINADSLRTKNESDYIVMVSIFSSRKTIKRWKNVVFIVTGARKEHERDARISRKIMIYIRRCKLIITFLSLHQEQSQFFGH